MYQEPELAKHVDAENMSIVHQRLYLLNIQWDEMQHQVNLRETRISNQLCHWGEFIRLHVEIIAWIEDMLVKITLNSEYNIEDLLDKVQNVSDAYVVVCDIKKLMYICS